MLNFVFSFSGRLFTIKHITTATVYVLTSRYIRTCNNKHMELCNYLFLLVFIKPRHSLLESFRVSVEDNNFS